MILLISAQQPQSEGPVHNRFGRSPWLIKIDTQTNQWEALPNPGASQSGGAGVAAAQFVVEQKVDAVISGDFGPNAAKVLQAAGIQMSLFPPETSTVQQAAERFLQGKQAGFE